MGNSCDGPMPLPSPSPLPSPPPRDPTPPPTPPPRDPTPPPTPPPARDPTPSPTPSIELSSDCVNIVIDDREDENKIDVTKDEYPHPTAPSGDINAVKPENNWYDDNSFNNSSDDDLYQHETVTDLALNSSLAGNRPPKPTLKRPKISFDVIDTHSKKAGDTQMDSFKKLIDYLTQPIEGDSNKELLIARAIVVWMSQQDVDNRNYGDVSLTSPRGLLQYVKEKRMTYATCYTLLCREAGLSCVLVEGVVKAAGYEPGDTSAPSASWSAVNIEGFWQIVHPFWICKALYGHTLGGWVKIEVDGATIAERERASKGVSRNTFQEHYFMPKPSEFIYKCFATDTSWQLLSDEETIKTSKHFFELPYLLPPFFGLGLTLLSEQKCVLESENGFCKIETKANSSNAHLLVLTYDLFVKDSQDSKVEQQLSRMVFNSRSNEFFLFDIRFPAEGTYKLVIYGGPHKSPKLRLCEFKLICKKKSASSKLLPMQCDNIGWGPGPETMEAGLLLPSKPSGLISVSKKTKKTDIKFQVKDECIRTHTYTASIHSDGEVGGKKIENVNLDESNRLLVIIVDLPQEGEFGLSIRCQTMKHGRGIDKAICNYLMSTAEQKHVKANVTLAKRKLRSAMELGETTNVELLAKIVEINGSLINCEKQKIPPSDEEMAEAKTKMEFLGYKYLLKSCIDRRQINVTQNTLRMIRRYQYNTLFRKMIKAVEMLEKTLLAERV